MLTIKVITGSNLDSYSAMAAEAPVVLAPTDDELLQAQADLWRHGLCYLTSMGLQCAVKLGIATAIHRAGGASSLPDLITTLSLPASKLPFLRRLMRLLVYSGIFAADDAAAMTGTYRLTPLSCLLVDDGVVGSHPSQVPLVHSMTSRLCLEAAMGLAEWFKKDHLPSLSAAALPSPFEEVHGVSPFDGSMANLDPEADIMFNEALAAHDNSGFSTVLVLHHWSDEDCVKILAQCKKAIPTREAGGKVIIIDIVIGSAPGHVLEAELLMDVGMMLVTKGRQRDENDWRDLFKKAGFSDYKIVKKLGARGVFEVYR
ncbi:hypothetical protein GUJ93_ZPchr0011g28070 [Zizania palustris]|uniref:Uncharacterized protein n=1 Tax=Zizania palustris TaxID=103762 RepID=A0A8J6BMI4_ZIZPA|nr:hypothetical protein GUJ93_ZPchr0011g28070 [Zizania palustris]